MSKLIKDISKDIKSKIKESNEDIRKAIDKKDKYSFLADSYYKFSLERVEEVMELHDEVVKFINEYKEEDIPKTMFELWDWEHKEILEDVYELKLLQEFYKNL